MHHETTSVHGEAVGVRREIIGVHRETIVVHREAAVVHRSQIITAILMTLAFCVVTSANGAEPRREPVGERFVAPDWQTVYQAEYKLEAAGAASLPFLVRLLDRADIVPLENTADLIYPGAKMFYGHGWMVDYDLDCLSARAGWALEELTFENFGFAEGAIREADLLEAVKEGKRDTPLANVAPTKVQEKSCTRRHGDAVARAKSWFRANGRNWSRFESLKAALDSDDPFRQLKALNWLRFGVTPCPGVTARTYDVAIRPRVVKLASSNDQSVREQAKLLLDDHEHYWLRHKTDPELRRWADPDAVKLH